MELYIGIMEKKMETTVVFFLHNAALTTRAHIGVVVYSILGIYWDNGKENGNYYSMSGIYIGIMEKKMETTVVYWGSSYILGQWKRKWKLP